MRARVFQHLVLVQKSPSCAFSARLPSKKRKEKERERKDMSFIHWTMLNILSTISSSERESNALNCLQWSNFTNGNPCGSMLSRFHPLPLTAIASISLPIFHFFFFLQELKAKSPISRGIYEIILLCLHILVLQMCFLHHEEPFYFVRQSNGWYRFSRLYLFHIVDILQ